MEQRCGTCKWWDSDPVQGSLRRSGVCTWVEKNLPWAIAVDTINPWEDMGATCPTYAPKEEP